MRDASMPSTLLLWAAFSLASACAFAGDAAERTLYEFNAAKDEAAKAWSMEPGGNGASLKYELQGGRGFKGSMTVSFDKGPSKAVELLGPEIPLESLGAFTTRMVKASIGGRAEGLPDNGFKVRLKLDGKDWAKRLDPNPDWGSILAMGKAKPWAKWTESGEVAGTVKSSCAKIRPLIQISCPDGKGSFEIDAFKLVERLETDHKISSSKEGNVFFGENAELELAWADSERMASGEISVKDELGREIANWKAPAKEAGRKLSLPGKGFFSIAATAAYEDGRTISTISSAASVGPKLDEAVRMASRFGAMRVHASESWAANLGSRLDWSFWNLNSLKLGEDGKLSAPPSAMKTAEPGKLLRFSAMNGPLPDWLSSRPGSKDLYPPKDWELFEKAVELWAANCESFPDVLTVFNEPNAHWRGSQEELIRFHKSVAKAVKRARPEAKVGGPCLYSISMPEFKRLAEGGILDSFDCVVMHAYVNATEPEAEFIAKIQELKAYLKEKGYGKMPLYLTEFGWNSPPGDWQKEVDILTKARYAARSMILCAQQDIDGMIYFCGRWTTSNGISGYNIVNADYTPQPAYAALAQVFRIFADVKGGGQWLKLTPRVNWIAFKKGPGSLVALWDNDGESSFELPIAPRAAFDMTGRPIALDGLKIAISQSPSYLLFDDPKLAKLPVEDAGAILPGDELNLRAEEIIPPKGMAASAGGVQTQIENAAGGYCALIKRGGELRAASFRMEDPLSLKVAGCEWEGGAKAPFIELECRSELPGESRATLKVSTSSGFERSVDIKLSKGKARTCRIELAGLAPFKRHLGKAEMSVESPSPKRAEALVDATFMSSPQVEKAPASEEDWAQIPSMDFSSWRQVKAPLKPDDLSGSMAAACAPEGFILRVKVRDNEHVQSSSPAELWKEDSMQVAFDADRGKEWQPNNVGFGLNGHRVTEYGFALKQDGSIISWRWQAYAPDLKSGEPQELKGRARIKRDEKLHQTVYEISFPWASLGLEGRPAPGSKIGFSLVVNDMDADGKRHLIGLFGGIAEGKDPKDYGTLLISPK